MRTQGEMILFWGGKFSQWYKKDMVIDGVTYNCCEQYMMAQKANMFDDADALKAIMAANHPKKQKAIGRTVKGFSAPVWEKVCRDIVLRANLAKFEDPELRLFLLATGNKMIVEASPYDKIWGIGLGEDDPRAWDINTWEGSNWLGEAIMQVREAIRNQGV